MHATLQDAYAEACAALGEQIVERRLTARLEAQKAADAEAKSTAEADPLETDSPKADPGQEATDAEQETPPAAATHVAPKREAPKPSDMRNKK